MKIENDKVLTQKDINEISPLVLAFLGDSIHTAYVRDFIIKNKLEKLNDYNKHASYYCKAKTQSEILDRLVLTEEESEIVRRTRNTKTNNIAKNSNLVEYKKATCFEALIGYLYLLNNTERMNEILEISVKG